MNKIESIGLFHGVNDDTFFCGRKWQIWPNNFFLEKVYCIIYATYEENDKAEIKKIKNLWNSFAQDSQTIRQMDRGRNKLGKILFLKRFFENSFYLIHFSCGLIAYHQTKIKLKFKFQNSENKQICCGV